MVLLVVLRGREDCRAARAASSSRRLHCKQVKPSLVSHALHSATSVAPAALVEKPGLHFLHTGVGSLTLPPVLKYPTSQAEHSGPPRPAPHTHVPLTLL